MLEESVVHDPECYLCPGNKRVGGEVNEAYTSTFSFTNDFSAVKSESTSFSDASPTQTLMSSNLFHSEPATGCCKVLCFSPKQ